MNDIYLKYYTKHYSRNPWIVSPSVDNVHKKPKSLIKKKSMVITKLSDDNLKRFSNRIEILNNLRDNVIKDSKKVLNSFKKNGYLIFTNIYDVYYEIKKIAILLLDNNVDVYINIVKEFDEKINIDNDESINYLNPIDDLDKIKAELEKYNYYNNTKNISLTHLLDLNILQFNNFFSEMTNSNIRVINPLDEKVLEELTQTEDEQNIQEEVTDEELEEIQAIISQPKLKKA